MVPIIARHGQWEMFVKKSLRDRFVCFPDIVGMTLLACLMPLAALSFLLLLHSFFSWSFFHTLFEDFFFHKHWLQFLAQQIQTSQQPQVLHPGRSFYSKIELWFTQLLVQVLRIDFHAVDYYLYKRNLYLCWSKHFFAFFVMKESWRLF